MQKKEAGQLLDKLRTPDQSRPKNQNKRWTEEEKEKLKNKYIQLDRKYNYKKDVIKKLCAEFGRGKFGIQRMLKKVMK